MDGKLLADELLLNAESETSTGEIQPRSFVSSLFLHFFGFVFISLEEKKGSGHFSSCTRYNVVSAGIIYRTLFLLIVQPKTSQNDR